MAKADTNYNNLIKIIDDAVSGFDKNIPVIQKQIENELFVFLREIELSSGRINNSVHNLNLINKLKAKIDGIILTAKYKKQVAMFAESFVLISQWHNDYFSSITTKFKPKPVLAAIRKNAIDWTIEGLTDKATASVSSGIRDLLNRNITTGGNYSDLLDQMRNHITTNQTGDGSLQRYVKQITTDSLNQYSAQYNQAISADLGFKWRRYVGSLLETSRALCVQLTEKEFYHISELPEILKGHIDGVKIPINPKTDLWYGAIAGTNIHNFSINRGGHGCGHQDLGVSEIMVPEHIKRKFDGKEVKPIWPVKKDPLEFVDKNFIENYKADINKDVFSILKKETKIDIDKSKNGLSYFDPARNRLSITDGKRSELSTYHKESVIYHELGHAAHFQNEIITFKHVREDFEKMFNDSKKSIKGNEADINSKMREKLKDAFINKDYDAIEIYSMAYDILGSLTSGNYGGGHAKSYYRKNNMKYMEVFAHGNTLHFMENPAVKELMPEVYSLLKEYFKNLYSNR